MELLSMLQKMEVKKNHYRDLYQKHKYLAK